MLKYVAKRLILAIPVLLAVSVLVFLMVRLLPGDPAVVLLGDEQATPENLARVREELGLNRPILEQYVIWLERALFHGDLGRSTMYRAPVLSVITQMMPATIYLALTAVLISVAAAIPLGVIAAVRSGSKIGHLTIALSQVGVAIPVFLVGIILIYIFGQNLRLFPTFGYVDPFVNFLGFLRFLIMPAVTLATQMTAFLIGLTRSSMLEVLSLDYVRTARAKGLKERVVVYKHALRNALIPTVTAIGLNIGSLLGGSVLTETIFAWPGVGRLLVFALTSRDYLLVQACLLIFSLIFIVVNLAIDLTYKFIDPKVRYE